MEDIKLRSPAIQILRMVWDNVPYASHAQVNTAMQAALSLVINSDIRFENQDFNYINSNFRPGYWMGLSANSYHYGEHYYSEACRYNKSATSAYEIYYKRVPFIVGGKRVFVYTEFIYNSLFCHITGWNQTNDKIMFVGYSDHWDKGSRKLFTMDKKEWLKECKSFSMYW